MANWKLRKDKTAAEPSTADPETNPAAEGLIEQGVNEPELNKTATDMEKTTFPESPSALPDFDSDADLHFTDIDFDTDTELPKEDEPLTLVDYSEPEAETAPAQIYSLDPPETAPLFMPPPAASAIAMPPPVEAEPEVSLPEENPAPVFEMPIPAESSDFLERLRTDRDLPSEPSSVPAGTGPASNGFAIPTVAPFVLDTPLPAAPPEPARQIVVHVGRLSAAFAIVKDVTTIGRPDSELHYYPDVEIETDDAVSRRHAEVVKRPDGFYLVDTGSTNGTMLNGETLIPHQEKLLAHGDRIRLGDRTEITFE